MLNRTSLQARAVDRPARKIERPGAASTHRAARGERLRIVDTSERSAGPRRRGASWQLRSYGPDSRREVQSLTSEAQRETAAAVAAVVHSERVQRLSYGRVRLQTEHYGRRYNLCPSERFYEQEAGAYGTAFLVARNLVATAAHVVSQLDRRCFVFGFRMRGIRPQTELPAAQVYEAAEVVGMTLDTVTGADWAVVRLGRPVPANVTIPRIRRSGQIADRQAVYVIGHPGGLTAKVADGARVRSNDRPNYFVANLDTYWHNSGSPVFNADDHAIEGVVVRGKDSFRPQDGAGGRMVSNTVEEHGGRGEDCVRASLFAHLVPENDDR